VTTVQPATQKRAQVPLGSIVVNQTEGAPPLLQALVHTWEGANKAIAHIRTSAPKDGSYYKTDVIITWADGFKVTVREDVKGYGAEYTCDISRNMLYLWQFYAGFRKPANITEGEYEEILAMDRKRVLDATEALTRYALVDGPKPATTVAQSAPAVAPSTVAMWPSQAQLNDIKIAVAELIRRAEHPVHVSANAAKARAMSMELRKALAALIRAQDIT